MSLGMAYVNLIDRHAHLRMTANIGTGWASQMQIFFSFFVFFGKNNQNKQAKKKFLIKKEKNNRTNMKKCLKFVVNEELRKQNKSFVIPPPPISGVSKKKRKKQTQRFGMNERASLLWRKRKRWIVSSSSIIGFIITHRCAIHSAIMVGAGKGKGTDRTRAKLLPSYHFGGVFPHQWNDIFFFATPTVGVWLG